MRPICVRPTMASRSKSSNVPVALAKRLVNLSRSAPSGRFISKMGSKANLESRGLDPYRHRYEDGPFTRGLGSYANVEPF